MAERSTTPKDNKFLYTWLYDGKSNKVTRRKKLIGISGNNLELAKELGEVAKRLHSKKNTAAAREIFHIANGLLDNTIELQKMVGEMDDDN